MASTRRGTTLCGLCTEEARNEKTGNNEEDIKKSVWNTGMGLWLGPSLRGPIPTLFFLVLIIGISLTPVSSQCPVDKCWARYNDAQQGITDGMMLVSTDTDATCIPVRTYYQCIKNMTRPCFGDINFHSVLKVVESRLKFNNCTKQGIIYEAIAPSAPIQVVKADLSDACKYKGKEEYRHCGLFGDPHLRTFGGHHQTCRVKGAWSLIDNEHLLIQVTNDPVGQYGTGTATTMLTVMIRRNKACALEHFLTYQAHTDYLPTTFVNGLSAYGPDDSVRIEVKQPGRRVAIHIGYIATTIILNQVGRYFTFAIKMPEDVIRDSKTLPFVRQLCVRGCPRKERINYKKVLAQKHQRLKNSQREEFAMSREDAELHCRESHIMNFYFDSCVFDLMTTGDKNFTLAAHEAWRDMLGLQPETEEEVTQDDTITNGAIRTSKISSVWTAFLIAITVCLMVSSSSSR